MNRKTAIFVDGENLVCRFQALVKKGYVPKPYIVHRKDEFVWNNNIFKKRVFDLRRISYYTSASGDAKDRVKLTDEIQRYNMSTTDPETSRLVPTRLDAKVFWKANKDERSRHVDIHITLDMLRTAYMHDIDQLFLFSGDGDFLPVVQEVMRRGKIVHVYALSKSASDEFMQVPDHSEWIDDEFFVQKPKET